MNRLLRILAWREILMLVKSLGHALQHVRCDLSHLVHVVLLLHSLLLAGNRVKRTLLLRERGDVLLRRWSETSCHGSVLSRAAFRTEHAVCRNLFTTCSTVHGYPPRILVVMLLFLKDCDRLISQMENTAPLAFPRKGA